MLFFRNPGSLPGWRTEFKNREVLVPFVYVLVVLFFAQGGGISAVASYATPIFSDAGVNDPRVTVIYAVGVASLLGNIASFLSTRRGGCDGPHVVSVGGINLPSTTSLGMLHHPQLWSHTE